MTCEPTERPSAAREQFEVWAKRACLDLAQIADNFSSSRKYADALYKAFLLDLGNRLEHQLHTSASLCN